MRSWGSLSPSQKLQGLRITHNKKHMSRLPRALRNGIPSHLWVLAETVGKFVSIPNSGSIRTYQPLAEEASVTLTSVALSLAAHLLAAAIGCFTFHTIG